MLPEITHLPHLSSTFVVREMSIVKSCWCDVETRSGWLQVLCHPHVSRRHPSNFALIPRIDQTLSLKFKPVSFYCSFPFATVIIMSLVSRLMFPPPNWPTWPPLKMGAG